MKAAQAKLTGQDGGRQSAERESEVATCNDASRHGKAIPVRTCRKTPTMREFTFRAVLLGLVMTCVLGAANATWACGPADHRRHLSRGGDRHGGAAADEGLACWKRTSREPSAPSANRWRPARSSPSRRSCSRARGHRSIRRQAYWKSTALMLVGGMLGILFVTLLRRVMVEDPELPFPESVAASEIHKAGQQGAQAAKSCCSRHGLRRGSSISWAALNLFAPEPRFHGADRHPGPAPQ